MIARDPEGASRDRYDLIIIGGGIHGAMLLLGAGQRGLRSLLVERGDFGGETSFQSLRIVHGGLRYLQALDLPRFFESVRERRWFLRTFPELVTPLPCLMPLYGEGLRRRGVLGAALCANDLLSLHRNRGVGRDRRLPAGRLISAAEVRSRFPEVDGSGLQGAALWYDAHMPDSQRLLMETLRWACALGGRALNYVEARELCAAGRGGSGISAIDTETGLDHRYHASVVVNATGPWGRRLAARFDRDAPELFRPSLAWNVWFARPAPSDCALALTARDNKDARTYFLHPWKGRLLAGTGHGSWRGDVEQPRPSEAQLDEFIADLNAAVPGFSLRRAEVVRVFAGLLPARSEGDATLAVRPVIRDHGVQGGPEGLFSVSGVKFTTSRLCAEKTLECIARRFPQFRPRSHAQTRPVLQEGWRLEAGELRSDPGTHGGLPLRWRNALSRLIAEESVQHLDDLVFRRTTLWEDPAGTASAAGELAALCGWGPSRAEEERSRLGLRLATTSLDDSNITRDAMPDVCYCCGALATSRDHVPPACLFPAEKDLPGRINYRQNLITVPSCDQHNSHKSKDDEYLQLILVHGYFNNQAARGHFNKKVIRALTRRPAMLVALYGNQTPVTVDALPTVAVHIERERFNRVLEYVCQGLYFYNYGNRWVHPIEIHTPVLLSINEPDSDKINELVANLSKAIVREMKDSEKRGDNPEIFWYQMLVDKPKNRLLSRMTFYEGFDVFAISDPLLCKPLSNTRLHSDARP